MSRRRVVLPLCLLALGMLAATLRLDWDPVPSVDGYKVYQGTASRQYDITIPAATNRLDVAGLTLGTRYFFSVTAVRGPLESAPSNEVHATPSGCHLSIECYTGDICLRIHGLPNTVYTLRTSTDLLLWVDAAVLFTDAGGFADFGEPMNQPRKFYSCIAY